MVSANAASERETKNSFLFLFTFFEFGIFRAVGSRVKIRERFLAHINQKIQRMTSQSTNLHEQVCEKARQLGISGEIIACGLYIICQNRNFVNAIDHSVEMDDYIYRAILREAFERRKAKAEQDCFSDNEEVQRAAQKDLTRLRREELTSDAFYRAVLPLMIKVLQNEPVLRLHAEEASAIVLELADFKRRHRSTSLTEIIVKKCSAEIEAFQAA